MQFRKELIAGLVAFLGFSPEAYGTAKNYDFKGHQPAALSSGVFYPSSGVIYRTFEAVNNMQIANTSCSEEQGLKKCTLYLDKKVDGVNLTYGIRAESYIGFSGMSKALSVLLYNPDRQKYQFFYYSASDEQFDDNAFPSIINLDIDEKTVDELMQKDKKLFRHYIYNPRRHYTPAEKENAHRDIVRTLEEILNGVR